MQTLTMQGIADLARVQRPVVSMWRSRFSDSERPFPAPTSGDRLLFEERKAELEALLSRSRN